MRWTLLLTTTTLFACGAPTPSHREQKAGGAENASATADGAAKNADTPTADGASTTAAPASGNEVFDMLKGTDNSRGFVQALDPGILASVETMTKAVQQATAANEPWMTSHAALLNPKLVAVRAQITQAITLAAAVVERGRASGKTRGYDVEAAYHLLAAGLDFQGLLFNDYHANSHQPDAATSPYIVYPPLALPQNVGDQITVMQKLEDAARRKVVNDPYKQDVLAAYHQISEAAFALFFFDYHQPSHGVDRTYAGARDFVFAEIKLAAAAYGNLVDDVPPTTKTPTAKTP